MKKLAFLFFLFAGNISFAQELYVFTEPASNMPANSMAVRVNTKLSRLNHDNRWNAWRVNPEVMVGVNRKLMFHVTAYTSDMLLDRYRFEGAGLYAKYRLYSADDIHRHFRIAAYGKWSVVDNPVVMKRTSLHKIPDGSGGLVTHEIEETHRSFEIDMDGEVSGIGTGVIATQLINRLALSGTAGYNYRLNNVSDKKESFQPAHAISWSASAGYLLLPKEYQNYKQTNFNLYLEVLGYNSIDKRGSYIDLGPAVQFIFNSVARLDLGYRTQLTGRGARYSNSSFVLKFEYDFLNVF